MKILEDIQFEQVLKILNSPPFTRSESIGWAKDKIKEFDIGFSWFNVEMQLEEALSKVLLPHHSHKLETTILVPKSGLVAKEIQESFFTNKNGPCFKLVSSSMKAFESSPEIYPEDIPIILTNFHPKNKFPGDESFSGLRNEKYYCLDGLHRLVALNLAKLKPSEIRVILAEKAN